MPKGDKFSPGDLVFAKVKGYPAWPARITGMVSKDRFKIYFYGTYETANLKNEDIWHYSEETKAKFAPKNMKRKGYTEGLEQLEKTPEIAAVDEDIDVNGLDTTVESTPVPQTKKSHASASKKMAEKGETPKLGSTEETPKSGKQDVRVAVKGEKRKTPNDPKDSKLALNETENKKSKRMKTQEDSDASEDSSDKTSRSGRVIKQKRLGADIGQPARTAEPDSNINGDGDNKGKKSESKVLTPEEEKARKLEKRKNKLRWLKIEQRLVELDIAVKSSLHLERPSPDRCITALEELNDLSLAPFMLKKQPDIVTTVRRLRKYIGPHSFNTWPDLEARKKMEKSIEAIQKKADQIYHKFKAYFAFQGEKSFSQMFEEEVEEFRKVTKGMEESKVLSMIRDPTTDDSLSDED